VLAAGVLGPGLPLSTTSSWHTAGAGLAAVTHLARTHPARQVLSPSTSGRCSAQFKDKLTTLFSRVSWSEGNPH
jgi:hypothetical protein